MSSTTVLKEIARYNGLVITRATTTGDYDPQVEFWVKRPKKKQVEIGADGVKKLPTDKRLIWLDLLMSGFYRQAKGVLIEGKECSGTKRCCLGVIADACPDLICELSGSELLIGMKDGSWNKSAEFLNVDLEQWLGITNDMQHFLARMNDENYSFEDIAFTIDTIF